MLLRQEMPGCGQGGPGHGVRHMQKGRRQQHGRQFTEVQRGTRFPKHLVGRDQALRNRQGIPVFMQRFEPYRVQHIDGRFAGAGTG